MDSPTVIDRLNWHEHLKELKKLEKLYLIFITEIDNRNQILKLAKEIVKINEAIEEINNMPAQLFIKSKKIKMQVVERKFYYKTL